MPFDYVLVHLIKAGFPWADVQTLTVAQTILFSDTIQYTEMRDKLDDMYTRTMFLEMVDSKGKEKTLRRLAGEREKLERWYRGNKNSGETDMVAAVRQMRSRGKDTR